MNVMKVYLGADHKGFSLKEKLEEILRGEGENVIDVGYEKYDPENDYTNIGFKLGETVTKERSFGIGICGGGAGICIAANKVKGVRAALCFNEKQARAARNDDDANILCLSADFVDEDKNIEIVKTFINSVFSPEERFVRRIREISEYES